MNNNDENQVIINNKQKKKPKLYVILICIILLFVFMAIVAMSVAIRIDKSYSSCDKLLDEATYVNGHSQTNISSENNHVDGLNVEYTTIDGYHEGYTIAYLDNTFVRTYKEFKR